MLTYEYYGAEEISLRKTFFRRNEDELELEWKWMKDAALIFGTNLAKKKSMTDSSWIFNLLTIE